MCSHCDQYGIWLDSDLVFPLQALGEEPNPDMPESVLAIYQEARLISPLSKRAAAGLLRLALQHLVDELDPGAGSINDKIGRLAAGGLDPKIRMAMDVLRVIGNEALHPGQIDLNADSQTTSALFGLINMVVEETISRQQHVDALYAMLPTAKVEAIERRDGTGPDPTELS